MLFLRRRARHGACAKRRLSPSAAYNRGMRKSLLLIALLAVLFLFRGGTVFAHVEREPVPVRTATDRGVVAVFDPRLGKANYRWDIVKALPPMRRTRERSEVEAFLREITGTVQPGSDD